jgi:ectoine hydroxylase-related dioxygenase (phytanoyl-CoA dioxygenase family)
VNHAIGAARDSLAREGYAVVEGALGAAETRDIRARLWSGMNTSEEDGVPLRGYAFDTDAHNLRVFHLFNLDPVFVDLIQRPLARAMVEALLGEDYLISNFSANVTTPGSGRMQLHADQGYVPPPWPDQPLACNVAWLLDDFTEDNGGTRYVPRSHLKSANPEPGDEAASVPIVAPAGSMLVMDGRLWHQTGANQSSNTQRAALFGYYVKRWLRPQINWTAALWPETVETLSPAFLDLLGYYSGNVETQVPNGKRARVPMPPDLGAARRTRFALGHEA